MFPYTCIHINTHTFILDTYIHVHAYTNTFVQIYTPPPHPHTHTNTLYVSSMCVWLQLFKYIFCKFLYFSLFHVIVFLGFFSCFVYPSTLNSILNLHVESKNKMCFNACIRIKIANLCICWYLQNCHLTKSEMTFLAIKGRWKSSEMTMFNRGSSDLDLTRNC